MKVLKLSFHSLYGNSNVLVPSCEVVSKPFSWCLKNKVMTICEDMDEGVIEPDSIPAPLFETWNKFGKNANGRSLMIPNMGDLNVRLDINNELRMYGTLPFIETILTDDFQKGDIGLRGFLQTLLNTLYVRKTSSFQTDLMYCAKQALKVWTKDSLFAFMSKLLGKNAGSISVADAAHVVHNLTGKVIDTSAHNFDIMSVASELPVDIVSQKRPDEFFFAAFRKELLEVEVAHDILQDIDGELYFGKNASYPTSWGVSGPEAVLWKATINTGSGKTVLEWAPMAGTLYDRAISSKQIMFPDLDLSIPFYTEISDDKPCILDGGLYKVEPKNFNTGIRYISTTQKLPVYRVVSPKTSLETLIKDVEKMPISRLPTSPDMSDIIKELSRIYRNELSNIDSVIGNRHFLVTDDLKSFSKTEASEEEMVSMANSSANIADHIIPAKSANIANLFASVWVTTHMMSDALCFKEAQNDDFTLESAIEYYVHLMIDTPKTQTRYLVSLPYSDSFTGKRKSTREIVNIDDSLDLSDMFK